MVVRSDPLGDRMKAYEQRVEQVALPGLPLVARVDGRAFSQFTKRMARPFDTDMADLMVETTKYVLNEIQASVGYTQSDEASFILNPLSFEQRTDLEDTALDVARILQDNEDAVYAPQPPDPTRTVLFGGRMMKLASIISGLASVRFLKDALQLWPEQCAIQLPSFDCRVFQVPSREEAVQALLWRELDATKNAVSMATRAYFPAARMEGVSSAGMQEMLFSEAGINFNDYPARFKRGVYVQKRRVACVLSDAEMARIPPGRRPTGPVLRSRTLTLDLPPLRRIANPVEVLLQGAEAQPLAQMASVAAPKSTDCAP